MTALLAILAVALPAPQPILPVEDAYPHVATDGRIVFQSNRAGGSKLFVAQSDGANLRQITAGPSVDVTPKWSPDGKLIAFASTRDGDEDIWIVDVAGNNLRNVTRHPGSDSHPSWSPDGKRIVFCSTRGDGENDDIYIVNVDGTTITRLTDNGLAWDTFPSFSPDGARVLFRRLLRQRTSEGTLVNSEIMTMRADGSDVVNLTRNAWFDGWPAWSPDGRRIVFSSNRGDLFKLYVMNADGSEPRQITDGGHSDVRPQWSSDGASVIFNREHDSRIDMLSVPVSPAG
jgi:TolB protein